MRRKIPTFPSTYFDWKKGTGTSDVRKLGVRDFPGQFYIKSARTGEVRLFLADAETMTDNEFFDGEAAAYFVPGGDAKVRIWC